MVKKKKINSLSIFFPCYNDENTISGLIDDAYRVGKKMAKDLQVIVIDDGSTDSSRAILKKTKEKYKELKLIFHKRNKGYGGALRSGFKTAKNEFIFYTDGDGQYNVQDLERLIQALTNEVDVVNGKKICRKDSFLRDIIGKAYYLWVKILFKIPIEEIDTDFRLVRKKMLDKIKLKADSGAICVELITKLALAGAKFVEVPIRHYDRKFGSSQFFRLNHIIKTLVDDLNLLWQLKMRKK